MNIVGDVDLVQRPDGKWNVYTFMVDPQENIKNWVGREYLMPMRWVLTSVVHYIGQFKGGRAEIYPQYV